MGDIKLTFLGGAGTVTGSKTLLEVNGQKTLIDCGMFQGLKSLRNLNRQPFLIEPSSIDQIILTHAHLDHCGFIPVLVKNGFRGEIHCTDATYHLTEIILRDSGKIQEEDAMRAAKHSYAKHREPKPLYTVKDVENSLPLFVRHNFSEWVILNNDVKFEFLNNGHILGSAFVNMEALDKKLVFSGDIGRIKPMLLYPPKKIKEADYLVLESTYGDRLHSKEDAKTQLREVIHDTYDKRGILMIPSFAVERTQELLYLIYQLKQEQDLPEIPIYLDSPMGVNSTKVYEQFGELQNLSSYELKNVYEGVKFITDANTSKKICLDTKPKIVIAGSGMMEGGRIVHYLNNHIGNKKNTLLFVGYQGEGTRGRAMLEGSAEIKFFGQYHKVLCEVRSISSLSAHGDQEDIINWLRNFEKLPNTIFLNHGEPHQSDALRVKINTELDVHCEIPEMYSEYTLS